MPEDEETTVRRRLSRLFEPVDGPVAPGGAAMAAEGSRLGPGLDPDLPWAELARSSADPRPLAAAAGPAPVRASGRAPESGRVTPDPSGRAPESGRAIPDPDAAARPPLTSLADEALPADGDGGRRGHESGVAADDAGGRRPLASRLPGPGAFDPGRRGVRALAAVAVVVVLVAGAEVSGAPTAAAGRTGSACGRERQAHSSLW
ncbi:hypothetical protein ACWEH1_29850 [Micromonospora chersina]